MNRESAEMAYEYVNNTVTNAQSLADSYINNEVEQRQAAIQPEIAVEQERQQMAFDRRKILIDAVREYGYPKPEGRRLASAAWNLFIFTTLTFAAYTFAVAILKDFNLGSDPRLYCAGLAIMAAGAVHYFLRKFQGVQALQKFAAILLLIAALTSLTFFALVRGDVMAHKLIAEPALIIDNMNPLTPPDPGNSDQVVLWLRLAMLSAAIGFELLAGISLFQVQEALRITNSEHAQRLQKELLAVEKELLSSASRLHQLLAAPAQLRAKLRASVHRGLMDASKHQSSGPRRVAALLLGAVLTSLSAQSGQLDLVIGIDLSKTQKAVGHDGKSEFEKNVQTVSLLLGNLPAASRVSIVAITNNSFSNPFTVLRAQTSPDSGYFGNRLIAARKSLILEWQKRAKKLQPSFDESDLLGFLQLLSVTPSTTVSTGTSTASTTTSHRRIVTLSDMRAFTRGGLDLETPRTIDLKASLKTVERQGGFAPLAGAHVYALGAGDRTGKKGPDYWPGLRQFWDQFVRRSGGTLRVFSPTREPEILRQITTP